MADSDVCFVSSDDAFYLTTCLVVFYWKMDMMYWIKVTEVGSPSAFGCVYLARRRACALSAAAMGSEAKLSSADLRFCLPFQPLVSVETS